MFNGGGFLLLSPRWLGVRRWRAGPPPRGAPAPPGCGSSGISGDGAATRSSWRKTAERGPGRPCRRCGNREEPGGHRTGSSTRSTWGPPLGLPWRLCGAGLQRKMEPGASSPDSNTLPSFKQALYTHLFKIDSPNRVTLPYFFYYLSPRCPVLHQTPSFCLLDLEMFRFPLVELLL